MFFFKDLAIKAIFSILFLSTTGNDTESIHAEHDFARFSITSNSIVGDVNQGQSSITDSFDVETCPAFRSNNSSKQCILILKNNNSSFKLYNLTEEGNKQNLAAERGNERLFVETSSKNINKSNDSTVLAFYESSINHIFNLSECQKFFISLCYLLALGKFSRVRLWRIIFKISWKLFGKSKRLKKQKISASETVSQDLSKNPSEKTISIQNDIACDNHEQTSDLSWENHVKNGEETSNSANDSHVDSDNESTELSTEEHLNTDEDSLTISNSNVKDLPTSLPPIRIPKPQLKPYFSFNSLDSLSQESCDENFPVEFFIFPSDCGNIGLVLGPEDWEKIEMHDSSEENLIFGDGGTNSTRYVSGYGRDEDWDVGSEASSNSPCQSHYPKEIESCLSCGSDRDPVIMATSVGCGEQMKGDAEMNWIDQWSVESDSFNDLGNEDYEDDLELYQGGYCLSTNNENEVVQEDTVVITLLPQ